MTAFQTLASLALALVSFLLAVSTAAAPLGSATGPPTPACSIYYGNMNKNAYHVEAMAMDPTDTTWWKAETLRGYTVKLTPYGSPNFDLLLSVDNVASKWNVFKVSTLTSQSGAGPHDFYYKVDKETQCTVQIRGRILSGLHVAEMRAY